MEMSSRNNKGKFLKVKTDEAERLWMHETLEEVQEHYEIIKEIIVKLKWSKRLLLSRNDRVFITTYIDVQKIKIMMESIY